MRRCCLLLAIATIAISASITSSASASVLLDPPPRHLVVGDGIILGTWYRSWDGGSRYVTARVYYGRRLVRTRRIRATGRWHNYFLAAPQQVGRWTVRVSGGGWHSNFPISVGIGD